VPNYGSYSHKNVRKYTANNDNKQQKNMDNSVEGQPIIPALLNFAENALVLCM
jgi:hypothetical protein